MPPECQWRLRLPCRVRPNTSSYSLVCSFELTSRNGGTAPALWLRFRHNSRSCASWRTSASAASGGLRRSMPCWYLLAQKGSWESGKLSCIRLVTGCIGPASRGFIYRAHSLRRLYIKRAQTMRRASLVHVCRVCVHGATYYEYSFPLALLGWEAVLSKASGWPQEGHFGVHCLRRCRE